MEAVRVGVRRGMMWFGRERLAETSYEAAVAEMSRPTPRPNRALWHLNAALNLNPKFVEAIELKRQITGKDVRGSDNSVSRDFVRRLALEDVTQPEAMTPATLPTVSAPSTQPSTPASVAQSSVDRLATATAVAATTPSQVPAPSTQPSSVRATGGGGSFRLPLISSSMSYLLDRYATFARWFGFDKLSNDSYAETSVEVIEQPFKP